jgi:Ca-activated chloride channel family protein
MVERASQNSRVLKQQRYRLFAVVVFSLNLLACRNADVARSAPLEARMELAAGEVMLEQQGTKARARSGTAVLAGAKVIAGKGARALLRLSDGSALFLHGGTSIGLGVDHTALETGELWLEVPAIDRKPSVLSMGDVTISAAESGLSISRNATESTVYVARGLAHISTSGGRIEVRAGERATLRTGAAPQVKPVAYWEDWTGGMADQRLAGGATGAGRIYGVDFGRSGSSARALEVTRQAVRVTLRSGIAETEVDQTFFNPGEREVEGWYWLTVPEGAIVTGFAVENNGALIDGELIERKEAARQYTAAARAGYEPALLEWIDGRSYRARIYPVLAGNSRRVVMRYLEMVPLADGRMRYLFPMRSEPPVRIGELSLSVDLGKAGKDMELSTLEDARIENGGEKVTMRRSGFAPQADFLLEAKCKKLPSPIRVARLQGGAENADFLMLRYVPDVEWEKAQQPPGAVVVVVDTSAGSDDTTRQLEVATAEAILRALSEEDRFALMALDIRPKVLYPTTGLAAATDGEVGKARELLSAHAPGGATDLGALFDVALSRLHGTLQPAVIYIGDGLATSGQLGGERLQASLRRSLSTSRARLFTVAVGGEANHGFLDALAHAGGGKNLRVDNAEEAGNRALELVAALKTPTLTDLQLDAGAGLDEVYISADGKISWGSELILLARSHHDLPGRVKVKGSLGSQPFEKSYSVEEEDESVDNLVPRLWAAAAMKKILGEAGGADEQRGTLVKLGLDYGLMTPFTSFLALESEQAYAAQGIQRKHQPGSGRLTSVAKDSKNVGDEVATVPAKKHAGESGKMGSQGRYGIRGPVDKLSRSEAREEAKPAAAPVVRPLAQSKTIDGTLGEKFDAEAFAPGEAYGAGGLGLVGSTTSGKRKSPASPVKSIATREPPPPPGNLAKAGKETANPPSTILAITPVACSDTSERPLFERALLWEKRLHTATEPGELTERYRAAFAACELPDWRAEALFLRLLANHIANEATVAEIFAFLAPRPEARFYLARVLLRRNAGEAMALVIEQRLFGTRVAWDKVDLELSAIGNVETRITRLKEYVARTPDDPSGGVRLVKLLARAGHADEALLFSRKLKAAGLLTPRLVLALGDLQADAGQTDDAIRTYSEIVEFDPRNLIARQLLGDVYLAHGWYDLAYAQFQTLAEMAPDNLLAQLRLAIAAAGAGRTDEALRIERKVVRAPGSPGPRDPRFFARLAAASHMARLMAEPPKEADGKRLAESMRRDLAELQLFQGPGVLVIATWEDFSADLVVRTVGKGNAVSGETIDAAAIGLSAALLPADKRDAVQVHLRNTPPSKPLKLTTYIIRHDGKGFEASMKRVELATGQTDISI